jgi:hypothetical protein
MDTGVNNIGIGFGAGTGDTRGNDNIYIGSYNGPDITNALYGNSIAIGNGVQITGSNQIVVGDSTQKTILMGNVSVGKSGNGHMLDISGSVNFTGTLYQNGNVFSSGSSSQWTTLGANIYYNGGNVSIGKTTNSYAMDISGSVSAVSFNATSDYRIKDNVVDISNYSIDNVKPRMYFNKMSNKYEYGFIADELQMEYPLLVNGMRDDVFENGEPNLQTVNYIGLIPLLVREIQELKKKLG